MVDRPKVGLLIQSSLEYGRGLLRGIGAYMRRHGAWDVYHRSGELAESLPSHFRRWKPRGIIAQIADPKLRRQVLRLKVPVVDLFTLYKCSRIPRIGVDNEAVARVAADHLLERGYKNFAYCGFADVFYCEERRQSLLEYLRQRGHELAVFNSPTPSGTTGVFNIEAAGQLDIQRMGAWIDSLPKPLGLIAGSDVRAQQVLSACSEYGIRVPDQVAVTGVGNDEVLCNLCDPLLSSVQLKTEEIGYRAATVLDRMMRGEKPERMLTLVEPLGMVTRQSTVALAIEDADVVAAVCFIRERALQGITVQDVVNHVAISQSTLQRRFARTLGRSPRQEIIRVQVERVKDLLARSDMPLARIAEMAGFSYLECMSKLFKSKMGLTPGQYRKQSRQDTWQGYSIDSAERGM
jgi:LacI family transcriptional regulator